MDLKQLYYFAEICKRMNFAVTADALFVTPQALSKSIKTLENSLGADVFHRYKNTLSLTSFGEKLLKEATPLLYEYERITIDMKILSRQNANMLKIGIIPSAQDLFNNGVVVSFLESYPDINLEMVVIPYDLMEESVLLQHVDLAVSVTTPDMSNQLLNTPILKSGICAIMQKKNPLYSKEEILISDLKDKTLVLHSDMHEIEKEIEEEGRKLEIKLRWRLKTPYTEINRPFMHQTNCIAIGPLVFCENFPYSEKVGFRPFSASENLNWEIGFLTRKNHYPSNAVTAFINHML